MFPGLQLLNCRDEPYGSESSDKHQDTFNNFSGDGKIRRNVHGQPHSRKGGHDLEYEIQGLKGRFSMRIRAALGKYEKERRRYYGNDRERQKNEDLVYRFSPDGLAVNQHLCAPAQLGYRKGDQDPKCCGSSG